MKKIVLLAVAIALTSAGIGYAMNIHQLKEHGKCENGMKCGTCNGTGWKGQVKCYMQPDNNSLPTRTYQGLIVAAFPNGIEIGISLNFVQVFLPLVFVL